MRAPLAPASPGSTTRAAAARGARRDPAAEARRRGARVVGLREGEGRARHRWMGEVRCGEGGGARRRRRDGDGILGSLMVLYSYSGGVVWWVDGFRRTTGGDDDDPSIIAQAQAQPEKWTDWAIPLITTGCRGRSDLFFFEIVPPSIKKYSWYKLHQEEQEARHAVLQLHRSNF